MLMLQRDLGESIHLFPVEDIEPDMTVAELFKDGDIIITVTELTDSKVKLGFNAPSSISIVRDELLKEST